MTRQRRRTNTALTAECKADRWSLIGEIHRAGITVQRSADVEWFDWHPRTGTVILAAGLAPASARSATALALAHRAYGHWGNSFRQDQEARQLAVEWLVGSVRARWAWEQLPTLGFAAAAARLGVSVPALRVRLRSTTCVCLSNAEIHAGLPCGCEALLPVDLLAETG